MNDKEIWNTISNDVEKAIEEIEVELYVASLINRIAKVIMNSKYGLPNEDKKKERE